MSDMEIKRIVNIVEERTKIQNLTTGWKNWVEMNKINCSKRKDKALVQKQVCRHRKEAMHPNRSSYGKDQALVVYDSQLLVSILL